MQIFSRRFPGFSRRCAFVVRECHDIRARIGVLIRGTPDDATIAPSLRKPRTRVLPLTHLALKPGREFVRARADFHRPEAGRAEKKLRNEPNSGVTPDASASCRIEGTKTEPP